MQEGATPGGAANRDGPLGDFHLPNVEVMREVARGGFGIVYEAHQTALNRTVAVKILVASVRDDHARVRFERECVAMGRLSDHPHIVTVFDAGFGPGGQPYILMDFMPGGSLADRVERDGQLPWQEVLRIGVKLSAALEMAHRAGVLHRDIKPENVLLSAYGEPALGDFGIARLQGGPETRTGTLTASIAHAAPELLAGEPPSVQTDLYALGSTLFVLMSGSPAFVRGTDESILPAMARITSDPVPDLRGRGAPEAVPAVIERLMAKNPLDRFGSAFELAHHLQDVQRELGLPLTPIHVADSPEDAATTSGLRGYGQTGEVGPPRSPTGLAPGLATGRIDPPPMASQPVPVAPVPVTPPPAPGPDPDDTAAFGPVTTPPAEPAPAEPAPVTSEPARSEPATSRQASPEPVAPPAEPAQPEPAQPAPAGRRLLVPVALGVVALLVVVVVAVMLLGGSPDDGEVAGEDDPAPSPTPVESPTSEPDGPDPAEGEGEPLDVALVAGQISEVRGLDVPDDLDARRYTTAAYSPLVRAYAGGSQADTLEEQGRVLAALHLIPRDLDYPELVRTLWEEQLSGFYDEEARRIHVRSDVTTLSVLSRSVLADETAVAMIDDAFDIAALHDGAPDLDADRAVTALLKGDTFVISASWAQRFLTAQELEQRTSDHSLLPDTRFRAAPQVVRADLVFPFIEGGEFVRALLEQGGQEALDAAYADPPTTTEQIIHPERYLAREQALPVSVTAEPGAGWDPLSQRTFGEFDLRQLFHQVETEAGDAAAAGWGGGELRAWTRAEETAVAVWLEFDTPADGEEACQAVATWYTAAGGTPTESHYTTADDAMALRCDAAVVRFAVAPDAGLAADLLG